MAKGIQVAFKVPRPRADAFSGWGPWREVAAGIARSAAERAGWEMPEHDVRVIMALQYTFPADEAIDIPKDREALCYAFEGILYDDAKRIIIREGNYRVRPGVDDVQVIVYLYWGLRKPDQFWKDQK